MDVILTCLVTFLLEECELVGVRSVSIGQNLELREENLVKCKD